MQKMTWKLRPEVNTNMSDQIRFESLVPELDMIEAEIKGQQYLMELPKLRNKVAWGGAGVIIASSPPSVTAETVVVTRLAREVAWFFYRIRDVAYGNQLMDSNSKFSFYRTLARRVIELQEGGNSVTGPKVVLLDLLALVKQMAIEWDDSDADS